MSRQLRVSRFATKPCLGAQVRTRKRRVRFPVAPGSKCGPSSRFFPAHMAIFTLARVRIKDGHNAVPVCNFSQQIPIVSRLPPPLQSSLSVHAPAVPIEGKAMRPPCRIGTRNHEQRAKPRRNGVSPRITPYCDRSHGPLRTPNDNLFRPSLKVCLHSRSAWQGCRVGSAGCALVRSSTKLA